jgi:hypothetical protein
MNDPGESRLPTKRLDLKALLGVMAALLSTVVTAPLLFMSYAAFAKINDLPQYYAAAYLVLSGKGAGVYNIAELFAAETHCFAELEKPVALFLPPPAVPLLIPLAWLPSEYAPLIWTILLVLAVSLSVYLIKRWLCLQPAAAGWLWSLTWLSGPAYEAVRIGQVAPLLLVAQVGGIMLAEADRVVPAGLCFAAFALKPQQIAPLLIYLAGAGRFRILGVVAAAVAVLCALSFFEVGQDGYARYLNMIADPAFLVNMQPELNPTIRGQLLRFHDVGNATATGVAAIFMLAAFLYCFLLGRRMGDVKDWLKPAVIAAVPIGLVTSLHMHDYDLVLLLPALAAFVKSRTGRRLPPWAYLIWACAFALFILPFYEPLHYEYLKGGGLINPLFLLLAAWALFVAQLTWRNRHDFQ